MAPERETIRSDLAAIPPEAVYALDPDEGAGHPGELTPPPPVAPPAGMSLSDAERRDLVRQLGEKGAALFEQEWREQSGPVASPPSPFTLPSPGKPVPLPGTPADATTPPVPAPTTPFVLPLPEPPTTTPGEDVSVPVPAAGPAPGVTPPAQEVTGPSPGPGGIPWDVIEGLAREKEKPSRQVPWQVIAGLAEGETELEPQGGPGGMAEPPRGDVRKDVRDSPFGGDPFAYAGRVFGRIEDELFGAEGGGDGAGGGEAGGGAGGAMMEVLTRIAEGVEQLVDLMTEAQGQQGGDPGGPGVLGPGGGIWGDAEDDETVASPSIDLFSLDRPGKTRDAAGRPKAEAPKRQAGKEF